MLGDHGNEHIPAPVLESGKSHRLARFDEAAESDDVGSKDCGEAPLRAFFSHG